MSSEDALIEACRLAPDDDAPRLVWADAVGGERGELVVIQCDLARGGLAPAEAAARRRRERELLARHGAAWAGIGAVPHRVELRRGFVEALELEAHAFVEHGEAILRRAPLLRSLTVTGLGVPSGDPLRIVFLLLESAAFRRLRGLELVGVGVQEQAFDYDSGFEGRGDGAARLLVESGALARLSALGISSSGLTAAGVTHLVASGGIEHLERLRLRGHDLGGTAVVAALGCARRVRSLDLHGVTELEAIVPALPPVIELHLSGIDDHALAALGKSRAAATVEALRLSIGALERGVGFRAFPRLRALDLHATQLADPVRGARDLADALPWLPSLRRLRFASLASEQAIRIVARALGPQLEELDLRGSACEPHVLEELQRHVAGEVVGNEGRFLDPLL